MDLKKRIDHKLIDLHNGVFFVKFKDDYDMNMTFLRSIEYRESPQFIGKLFTISEYIRWYSKENDPKERKFTYARDWAGFNIPADTIENLRAKADLNWINLDWNEYDYVMAEIASKTKLKYEHPYLISGKNNYINKTKKKALVKHELAHAMYYIDHNYQKECLKIFKTIDPDIWKKMTQGLIDKGYANKLGLIRDEIQAYLAADNNPKVFSKVKIPEKDLMEVGNELRNVFNPAFKKFISKEMFEKCL